MRKIRKTIIAQGNLRRRDDYIQLGILGEKKDLREKLKKSE